MANLPKRDIIFNNYITGVDAKPYFEMWYDALCQSMGFCKVAHYTLANGVIFPTVSEFTVDTQDEALTDDLVLISTNTLHVGAIIRVSSLDASRIVTMKHSDNLDLNGADIVLSPNFFVELKLAENGWKVANSYYGKLLDTKVAEAIAIANTKLGATAVAANSNLLKGMNFHWSGQGGQPTWLWGSNDGVNHYVYNPGNFSVNYATSAAVLTHGGNRRDFHVGNGSFVIEVGNGENNVHPGQNYAMSCGVAGNVWSVVYANTTTISRSDERLKSVVEHDDRLFNAWSKVNFTQYQLNISIEEKGLDKARIHSGYLAQQIKQSFEEEGLDPFRYSLLCYDEWEDEKEDVYKARCAEYDVSTVPSPPPQEAGSAYSLRYEECLCVEAAYQRWCVSKLEARLVRLEALLDK